MTKTRLRVFSINHVRSNMEPAVVVVGSGIEDGGAGTLVVTIQFLALHPNASLMAEDNSAIQFCNYTLK